MKCVLLFLTPALLVLTEPALGQPYKCTVEGKITYQEVKCAGGQQVNTSGAGKADPASQGSLQARQQIAKYKRQERVDAAITDRKIFVGMTRDEVIASWGNPIKINKTLTSRGSNEQWIYSRGKIGNDQYVYVDNGVVQTIQSPD